MTQPTNNPRNEATQVSRRRVLSALVGAGVGAAVFQRSLAAEVSRAGYVTADMVRRAEWVSEIELTDEERDAAIAGINHSLRSFREMREIPLSYTDAPATVFSVEPFAGNDPSAKIERHVEPIQWPDQPKPDSEDELAFLSLTELASLIRKRKISSVELTKFYLDRLKRYDPTLYCVITLTEQLALKQAERADREIAAGEYKGPLHGVPWGAKDLISVPGYATTWGAQPNAKKSYRELATIAERLQNAGAVLVAKLSLGALAWGDHWFGKQTRNPWNPGEGSSGSSAGSAAATAAGLVGFSIGSETLGSIVSPSRRCGTSGLRPTFGRVSRYGCMPLSWTMDKIGPICRSVQDCALVFSAIHGADGRDPTAVSRSFSWPSQKKPSEITIGYFEDMAESKTEINVLKELGYHLTPLKKPKMSADPLTVILDAEAGCMFDDFARQHITEGMNRWPGALIRAQFIPAVEYLRASRLRVQLMNETEAIMQHIDAFVGGDELVRTNLTGHPSVVLPNGFEKRNGVKTPVGLTFTGKLFGETDLLAIAHNYQQATGFHLEHAPVGHWAEHSNARN